MSGQQRAVIWIGLIMVALNLVMRWSDIRAVIFGSGGFSLLSTPSSAIVPGSTHTTNPPAQQTPSFAKPGVTVV